MLLPSRSFRRSVFCLLILLSGACRAQQAKPQFLVPAVIPTGNWPANIAAGDVNNTGKPSLVSCDPPLAGVTLACHLYQQVQGVWTATETYPLPGATTAKAVIVNDPVLGLYGVAILSVHIASPAASSTFTVQFYADGIGTPTSAIATTPGGAIPKLGDFAYRPSPARFPEPGLFLATDSANGYFYILPANSTGLASASIGTMMSSIIGPIPSQAGAILPNLYPITGTHGGRPAFAVASTDATAIGTVVMNPDGTWTPLSPTPRYTGSGSVHSALLADMDGDGIADLITEGDSGRIDIYHGLSDGTFATVSEGGSGTFNGVSGNGGHLVAVDPNTLDILTTTPIGLSVLVHPVGSLAYALKGIYNIGPGRASYGLADFNADAHVDLAVDSPEGIAIVLADANGDGGFQTSQAFSALAPALGSVVGKFRNLANNPKGNLDIAVNTGGSQGQLLMGNGDGTFTTYPSTLAVVGIVSPNVWANILSGDFNGDGIPDIAYSLTGLPALSAISVLIQDGNGDGTFGAVIGINPILAGLPGNNSLFGESAVGDFNGDGITDIANIDANHDDTLLGQNASSFKLGLNATAANAPFSQVASGFFKLNRSSKQDLVFQQGANFIPYINSGDGKTFTAMTALAGSAAPYYAATVLLTDLDGDGNGDLVVVYYNTAATAVGAGPIAPNQAYIWWGNGDGTFTSSPTILSLSRNDYLGAVADMNHDGRPDLILSDGSLVGILYNQGSRTFGSEAYFLAGQGINSLSIADVNHDGQPDLIVANGGATISNPVALGGATATSLSLTSNPDVNTGGITVLLNSATTQPVTGTLAVNPEPSNLGDKFILIAAITSSAGVAQPTGIVTFYIDGVQVGTGNLGPVPGSSTTSSASFPIPAGNTYASGLHALSATYSGDAANSALNLSGAHIIQGGTTSVTLALCVGPSVSCPSNGFVNPPYVPTLTMIYGQTYNGTAGVTASDGGALPGNTLFYDTYNGAAPLLLCTLQTQLGGTCPPSVGIGAQVGTHIFTAVYAPGPGDTHTGNTSPPVTIIVTQDTVTASLTGTPNPSTAGQPVTFAFTLTGSNAPPPGSPGSLGTYQPPAGQVVFTYGATLLGIANLVANSGGASSTATLTTSVLPVGTDTITATSGASLDFASASATTTETITPSLAGSFTLTVAPTPVSIAVGYGALLTVTVTPQNGFSQTVNLACGNLPTEASCFFDTSQIASGSGATQVVIRTTAPHSCGSTQPYFYGSNNGPGIAPFALPTLAGLAVLFLPGKRRWLRALIAIVIVATTTHITGCGNCTDLGTRPATYTFQITATAATTAETQSQPVTITVTL